MPGKLTHASFVVERIYNARPARVFDAFVDADARRRWLIESDGWTVHAYDPPETLKPGAAEHSRFSPPGGEVEITNDTVFLEIEDNALLVFAYSMTIGGAPLSSSLVTVEIEPEGTGARLTFTEQGAYRDGNVAGREAGTRELLETLAREVARGA